MKPPGSRDPTAPAAGSPRGIVRNALPIPGPGANARSVGLCRLNQPIPAWQAPVGGPAAGPA